MAGWWFGTWLLLFHILGMSSSQLTNSYFSEGLFYHQPDGVDPQIQGKSQIVSHTLRMNSGKIVGRSEATTRSELGMETGASRDGSSAGHTRKYLQPMGVEQTCGFNLWKIGQKRDWTRGTCGNGGCKKHGDSKLKNYSPLFIIHCYPLFKNPSFTIHHLSFLGVR